MTTLMAGRFDAMDSGGFAAFALCLATDKWLVARLSNADGLNEAAASA
jgi:hypothetical protein